MNTTRYVYWQEHQHWIGYLEDYPDYRTQGETLVELQENLKDIYADLAGGHIPGARKVAELPIA